MKNLCIFKTLFGFVVKLLYDAAFDIALIAVYVIGMILVMVTHNADIITKLLSKLFNSSNSFTNWWNSTFLYD